MLGFIQHPNEIVFKGAVLIDIAKSVANAFKSLIRCIPVFVSARDFNLLLPLVLASVNTGPLSLGSIPGFCEVDILFGVGVRNTAAGLCGLSRPDLKGGRKADD